MLTIIFVCAVVATLFVTEAAAGMYQYSMKLKKDIIQAIQTTKILKETFGDADKL